MNVPLGKSSLRRLGQADPHGFGKTGGVFRDTSDSGTKAVSSPTPLRNAACTVINTAPG